MIKRIQIQFIALTMSILFAIFGIIFGACSILLKINSNRMTAFHLDNVKHFYETTGVSGENPFTKTLYAKSSSPIETSATNTFLFIYYNGEDFEKENINNLLTQIILSDNDYGSVDNFYFKIYDNDTIVVADMEKNVLSYRSNLLTTGIILLCIYGILLIIVWCISYRIIQPLKDTLNKQRQFISNASHELKTPVTVISANADVLQTIDNNQWLSNIKSQTKRMEVLVSDMLTLAKLDEGNIPISHEEFNLSDEIISTILPFDALCYEKGKHLEMDIPKNVTYHGDRQSVKKILNILLDNAIKYSNKDGTIKVALKKENHPIITVFNTGSEIKENETDKLFIRFYRGDNSRARSSGGSGLGLAIAKGIADANKWKISAESKYHESMRFTLIL